MTAEILAALAVALTAIGSIFAAIATTKTTSLDRTLKALELLSVQHGAEIERLRAEIKYRNGRIHELEDDVESRAT